MRTILRIPNSIVQTGLLSALILLPAIWIAPSTQALPERVNSKQANSRQEATSNAQKILSASEIDIPGYQKHKLQKDLPARDLLLDRDTLWVLGQRYLWKWNLIETKSLQRIKLQKAIRKNMALTSLGTDGVSIFTASAESLLQIRLNPLEVLKFELKNIDPKIRKNFVKKRKQFAPLGFAGWGDDFWWIHSAKLYNIDRYGKTLIPKRIPAKLKKSDLVQYDPFSDVLWVSRDRSLYKIDTSGKPREKNTKRSQRILKSKGKIRSIKLLQNGLLVQTSQTLLKLDEKGSILRAIPVESSRKLLSMSIGKAQHGYLFDDGLLEIYKTNRRHSLRYRVPSFKTRSKEIMSQTAGNLFAWIDRGTPRVLRLARPATSP